MTEREFRRLIRKQILEKFEFQVKKEILSESIFLKPMTESDLRNYIRRKIKNNFLSEQKEEQDQVEVNDEMLQSLEDLSSEVMAMAKATASETEKIAKQNQGKQIKNESFALFAAGLALGIPGILSLGSKLAKKIRAEINLAKYHNADVTVRDQSGKVINVPTAEEGETLARWADKTHHLYIKALSLPAVPFVGKEKAEKFGVALYATLLAGIAIASLGTASISAYHGLKSAVDGFGVAYEAAHGAHAGLEAAEMAAPLRAALIALGEDALALSVAGAKTMVGLA